MHQQISAVVYWLDQHPDQLCQQRSQELTSAQERFTAVLRRLEHAPVGQQAQGQRAGQAALSGWMRHAFQLRQAEAGLVPPEVLQLVLGGLGELVAQAMPPPVAQKAQQLLGHMSAAVGQAQQWLDGAGMEAQCAQGAAAAPAAGQAADAAPAAGQAAGAAPAAGPAADANDGAAEFALYEAANPGNLDDDDDETPGCMGKQWFASAAAEDDHRLDCTPWAKPWKLAGALPSVAASLAALPSLRHVSYIYWGSHSHSHTVFPEYIALLCLLPCLRPQLRTGVLRSDEFGWRLRDVEQAGGGGAGREDLAGWLVWAPLGNLGSHSFLVFVHSRSTNCASCR